LFVSFGLLIFLLLSDLILYCFRLQNTSIFFIIYLLWLLTLRAVIINLQFLYLFLFLFLLFHLVCLFIAIITINLLTTIQIHFISFFFSCFIILILPFTDLLLFIFRLSKLTFIFILLIFTLTHDTFIQST